MEEDKEKEIAKEEISTQESEEQQEINQEEEISAENQNKGEIIEVKKKKRKGSYITGTIGAILGGLILVLPWIFRYIFARKNFTITLLSMVSTILIPIGAYCGYKIFKGKLRKPCLTIITIVSILIIIISTTVICPIYLMVESLFPITWDNYVGLFSEIQAEVRDAIIEDTVAGLVFTIIGIVITVSSIRKKLDSLITEEERILINEEAKNNLKEKSEIIKKACQTLNCMSAENATSKKVILRELKNTYKLKRRKCKQYFIICEFAKLLKEHNEKYYYDENDETAKIENAINVKRKFKRHKIIKAIRRIIITILLLIAIAVGTLYLVFEIGNFCIIEDTDVSISINRESQTLYATTEEIKEEFGAATASYYDFIVTSNDEQSYDMYGQIINKSKLENYNFNMLMQEDRDYYAQYYTEEMTSEVSDKQLGRKHVKTYNYKYGTSEEEIYTAVVYSYQTEQNYVFINVFEVDLEEELSNVDELVKDLLN